MNKVQERPLVTFALLAYNQEAYVREAVAGALAQDYEPLQVVLSDDCSVDRTFEIMQEIVAAYRGPHRLVLNRNRRNLGIGGHVNKIVDLARGELIIGAAGDDISLPERASELVNAWLNGGRVATSIYSGLTLIDNKGREIGQQSRYEPALKDLARISRDPCAPYGAAHAFTRELMTRFGHIDSAVTYEDQVIGYRSALSGEFAYVDKPLVKYRIHEASICSGLYSTKSQRPAELKSHFLKTARYAIAFRSQNLNDARRVRENGDAIFAILRSQIAENKYREFLYSRVFGISVALKELKVAHASGGRLSALGKDFLKALSWPIYAAYYDSRRRLSVCRQRAVAWLGFS